jgi:drug/metabolite transporter (DMT)-like permease
VAVGFGGVLLMARPWSATGHIDGAGVAAMLVGSTSVGLSFVYARRFLSGLAIPAAALTTYQMGIALATLSVSTDFHGITAIRNDHRALVALIVGLGLFGTGFAYILYYLIVERLGAVTASSATYIPPVVALLIGWLLVDEPIDVLDLVAMLLIVAGVVLLRVRWRGGATGRAPARSVA